MGIAAVEAAADRVIASQGNAVPQQVIDDLATTQTEAEAIASA